MQKPSSRVCFTDYKSFIASAVPSLPVNNAAARSPFKTPEAANKMLPLDEQQDDDNKTALWYRELPRIFAYITRLRMSSVESASQ